MSGANDLYKLPEDLPVPEDDGACDHLTETRLPSLGLLSTAGETVDLSALAGRTVVYCYPRTGDPKKKQSAGWNEIPGARGCTPLWPKNSSPFLEVLARAEAQVVR